jgi:hypothetical protein
MAINSNLIRRPSDRSLYLAAGILFPLLVFIGYFKTYYFASFFNVPPIANSLVHLHGIVMSLWVIYFTAQVALVRTKNVKLHMTLGMAGIGLAVLVVIIGLATAYDSHIIRQTAPAGMDPLSFMVIPLGDMLMFIIFFTGAILCRKRPTEHKALMLMTAINFAAPAIARIQVFPPEYIIVWAFGVPCLIAIAALVWHSLKHRRINKILAAAVFAFVALQPLRMVFGMSETWIGFARWIFY